MTYIGQQPSTTFDSGIQDRFTGLSSNTVTLTHEISSEVDILVVWNNIVQDSGTYSVGGTGNKTLTLGGTLVSADVVTVYYLNKVMQSVNPTANSVGITELNVSDGSNGQALTTNGSGTLSFSSAGASLTGSTDNTVVTVTGANAMQGEANLTHDGTTTTMKATAGAATTETAVITTANNANPAYANLVFKTGGNTSGVWLKGVQASGGNDGRFEIHTNNSGTVGERVRIPFNGGVLVSTTTNDGNSLTGGGDFGAIVNCQSGKTPGFAFQSDGLVINRSEGDNNNRDIVMFYRNGSNAGNISASNSSVTYGTFLGVHYAQLTDDSKPDILVGTVMESINETSEWHMAQFTVPEYTEDGVTYPSQVLKRYIPKTNSVGDNIKFKWHKNYKESDEGFDDNAIEYDAVVIKENDEEYLARVKVSDTEDSKAVYGVFESWMESEANDISVGSLGAFMIRVHKDETVSIGDYLQSKGDGTAKVQADDILRASTIAKVVKTNKIKTYDDGSYLVSCTLHCG